MLKCIWNNFNIVEHKISRGKVLKSIAVQLQTYFIVRRNERTPNMTINVLFGSAHPVVTANKPKAFSKDQIRY